jgi:hypothetical protein
LILAIYRPQPIQPVLLTYKKNNMQDYTGTIGTMPELLKAFPNEPRESFRPVATLTERQKVTNQALAYEPCPCGSGEKFKFCCHKEAMERKNREQAIAAANNRLAAIAEVRKGATY